MRVHTHVQPARKSGMAGDGWKEGNLPHTDPHSWRSLSGQELTTQHWSCTKFSTPCRACFLQGLERWLPGSQLTAAVWEQLLASLALLLQEGEVAAPSSPIYLAPGI